MNPKRKTPENFEQTLFWEQSEQAVGQSLMTPQDLDSLSADSVRDLTVEPAFVSSEPSVKVRRPMQKPDDRKRKAPLPNTWRISVDASVYQAACQICQERHVDSSHYLTLAAQNVLCDIDELVFAQVVNEILPKRSEKKAWNRIPVARNLLERTLDRASVAPESPSIYILERIANRIAERQLSQHLVREVKKLIFEDRAR